MIDASEKNVRVARSHSTRLFLFVILGCVISWQIVSVNLSIYLADIAPFASLFIAPKNAQALVALADAKLAETYAEAPGQTLNDMSKLAPHDRLQLRKWAIEALTNSPLNADGFRILGLVTQSVEADAYMQAAVRRSLHDPAPMYWLIEKKFSERNYDDVARYADLLLRVDQRSMAVVAPFLVAMAQNQEASVKVDKLLATTPVWRDDFLLHLPEYVSDSRTPLRIMLPLQASPHPPSQASIRQYIVFLFNHRLYSFAYDVWRQFLPLEQLKTTGLLFNGDFKFPLTDIPFNWKIVNGAGVSIGTTIISDDPKSRALSLRYSAGRADPHYVEQVVKLLPGIYRMEGIYNGELLGRRGLHWTIRCIDGLDYLGESEMMLGAFNDWTRFDFNFSVPASNCDLQKVKLELAARSPSELQVSGEIWYTNLAIKSNSAISTPSAGH